MSKYQKMWADAKKAFERETGEKKPAPTEETVFGVIRKGTGIEAILKKIDTAIEKKQRTPIRQGMQEFFTARAEYDEIISNAQKGLEHGSDQWMELHKLKSTLNQIVAGIEADLKTISEEKSPSGKAMSADTFLGDVQGELNKYKKEAKKNPEQEKLWKLEDKCKPLIEELEKYQKAAAQNEFTKVATSLDKCITKIIPSIITVCNKILAQKNLDAAYSKSVKELRDFLQNLIDSRLKRAKTQAEEFSQG